MQTYVGEPCFLCKNTIRIFGCGMCASCFAESATKETKQEQKRYPIPRYCEKTGHKLCRKCGCVVAKDVGRCRNCYNNAMRSHYNRNPKKSEKLTVLSLLAEGVSVTEISRRLHMKASTIKDVYDFRSEIVERKT